MNFTERLNHLFMNLRKPDGSLYSVEDIEQLTNGRVTANYVYRLKNGASDNPTYQKMILIAQAFEINPTFFLETGEVTAQTVHELRTPLQTILGLLQVWRRVFDNPRLLQDLDEMEGEVFRLLNLFTEIVDLSELDRTAVKEQLLEIIKNYRWEKPNS